MPHIFQKVIQWQSQLRRKAEPSIEVWIPKNNRNAVASCSAGDKSNRQEFASNPLTLIIRQHGHRCERNRICVSSCCADLYTTEENVTDDLPINPVTPASQPNKLQFSITLFHQSCAILHPVACIAVSDTI